MSGFLIALLAAISVGTWIYTKLVKSNGDVNLRNNIIGASVIGLIVFLVVFTLFSRLNP